HRGDLIRGAPRLAQLDDPRPRRLLGRCRLGAGAALDEELALTRPEVAHHRRQRLGAVAEALGDDRRRCAFEQVGPQRLVAALCRAGRGSEELATGTGWGRYRCLLHTISRAT